MKRREFVELLVVGGVFGANASPAVPGREELRAWFLNNVYGHAPLGRPSDMSFKGNHILFGHGKLKVETLPRPCHGGFPHVEQWNARG